jgi:hypothetical protein
LEFNDLSIITLFQFFFRKIGLQFLVYQKILKKICDCSSTTTILRLAFKMEMDNSVWGSHLHIRIVLTQMFLP